MAPHRVLCACARGTAALAPYTMLEDTTIGVITERLADRTAETMPSLANKPAYPTGSWIPTTPRTP